MEIGKPYKVTLAGELGVIESLLKVMLEKNMVDMVLGTEAKKNLANLKPTTIEKANDVGEMHMDAYLAFDFAKTDSSAKYIHKKMNGALTNKVGAFGRPCDLRALVELHKRRQVNLDNIILIGIEEYGRLDPKLMRKFFKKEGIDASNLTGVIMKQDKVIMELGNESREFPFGKTINIGRNCANCTSKTAMKSDITVNFLTGDPILTVNSKKGLDVIEQAGDYLSFKASSVDTSKLLQEIESKGRQRQLEEIQAFRDLPTEQKIKALGKCTMCGLCIRSCPVCFCVDCIIQKKRKEKAIDNFTYQLTRISHIADTCIQCGRCDSICPVNLPLNIYFNDIAMKLEEKYGYVAGRSLDENTPRSDVDGLKKRLNAR
ncbi:hypothetical protein GF325_10270 [Candidatus Bathyarchaeota archaeon]|nr:hypothetical protein [Candidatus Bathyarchaeota archaeon]